MVAKVAGESWPKDEADPSVPGGAGRDAELQAAEVAVAAWTVGEAEAPAAAAAAAAAAVVVVAA